ncbi:helicase [Tulasnella sp. 419]|nr:helicase [Tulasnella sp. 419]
MSYLPGQKRKSSENDPNPASRKKHASLLYKLPQPKQNETQSVGEAAEGAQYWAVQWRKPTMKKNKTWEGDGVLVRQNNACVLHDTDGKETARAKVAPEQIFVEDAEFTIGGKEICFERQISGQEFLSGTCFGSSKAWFEPNSTSGASLQTTYKPKGSKTGGFRPSKPLLTINPTKSLSTKALLAEKPQAKAVEPEIIDLENESSYWTANWRKPTMKKNKTWDGDGIVTQEGMVLALLNENGKLIGTTGWSGEPLKSGTSLFIAGKEVELDEKISEEDYKAGRFQPSLVTPSTSTLSHLNSKKYAAPTISKPLTASLENFYSDTRPKAGQPRHDPNAEDAIVMKTPPPHHQAKYNKKNLPVVPVVVDPHIGRHLRPHQKEGVKFLYESVMGMRKHEGNGCILADEMGLGKTLQTVALIWTLLKQNPYGNVSGVVGKVMIVCPVSLINNWKKEVHKWLGRDRVQVFVGDKDKAHVKQFANSRTHQILIIGYEKLRNTIADLAYCTPPIGLIICDEGHRLKSANNKTSKMFEALRTTRRVILSGTPIQNDLGEFHAMADFCNPGLLDDYKTFARIYETPIVRSRAPDCTAKERELGQARSDQLMEISKSFVLRRTAEILNNYLPPKHEYVVFVKPTALQLSVFSKILSPQVVDDVVHGPMAKSLALISTLTKVCNSPMLLKKQGEGSSSITASNVIPPNIASALSVLPSSEASDLSISGKLTLLGKLLQAVRTHTEEKCVLVSNYTSTLNIIEEYCKRRGYTYYRLDGSTKVDKRQQYVDDFNRSTQKSRFLFLLSTKAGGVGLNLIGASRLVLIDSDWNPAHDLQAMARIHRDGQKRDVFIYRLVTTGTIDEKIFQRQVTKIGLSDSLMSGVRLPHSRPRTFPHLIP